MNDPFEWYLKMSGEMIQDYLIFAGWNNAPNFAKFAHNLVLDFIVLNKKI